MNHLIQDHVNSRTYTKCLLISLIALSLACASGSGNKKGAELRAGSTMESLSQMRQGSLFLQQGRYDEALKQFQTADRTAPGNATVQNMLGLCHLRMANYDLALLSFNRALELIPTFTDARNNRGTTYLAMSQFRLAEVDFAAVLGDTTYSHHWEAFYNLGLANLGSKNIAGAESSFRRAITAPSPVFEAFLRQSEIMQQRGDLVSAERLLEEARLIYPDRPEAGLYLGRLLITLNRPSEARPLLQRLITSYPESRISAEASRLLGN